jgi:hypothetical protein
MRKWDWKMLPTTLSTHTIVPWQLGHQGLLYTRSQGNFEHFWVANWPPKFYGILFPALGPIQGHKVQHLLVLGQIEIFFFPISPLTPSVKPLGLLSTFAQ